MPSQVAQVAPNAQHQHLQVPSQVSHQNPPQQQQPLQPIASIQALQMQQQKMKMNVSQAPIVGPTTATVVGQNRSQHQPQQHPQRAVNSGVPDQPHQQLQTHSQIQQQPLQYQQPQQQRFNAAANARAQQYHQTQPVLMPTKGNNTSINPQQQIRQANPQQKNSQYLQQRNQSQQQHTLQNQTTRPIRSIPTPSSQNSLTPSPVPAGANTHTPLYERLVTEEVKELKEYVRLIEQQSRRITDLEKIHLDLENRLEAETIQRQRLEFTLQYRERYWKSITENLDKERSNMETNVKEEKIKVERLLDMVNRLQNEIQSMIKNKFNPSRSESHLPSNNSGGIKRVSSGQAGSRTRSESGTSGGPRVEGHASSNSVGGRNTTKRHIGPHELLAFNGSAEAVRERNAFTSLFDFFGM